MGKYKIALLVLPVILLFIGCGKKSPTKSTQKLDELEAWNAHNELQLKAWAVFDSIAILGDTNSAISAAISLLENSDKVDWAIYNGCEGISVRYKDAGAGFIIVRELERASKVSPGSEEGNRYFKLDRPMTFSGTIPTKKGAAFYCPYYDEANRKYAEPIYNAMTEELPKVGFPHPEGVFGEDVTPRVLASISGKGMIHLQSHIYRYPSKDNIQEVYFVLTAEQDSIIDKEFEDDINAEPPQPLRLLPGIREGRKIYGVAPAFLAEHNKESWQEDKPVIWNGMCCGFRGTWPRTMVNAGASVYLAWDQDVYQESNLVYACKFYKFMCDTPATYPFGAYVFAYYIVEDPRYFDADPAYNRWVQLGWLGDPYTSFQETIEYVWTIGPCHPTFNWVGAAWDPVENTLVIDFLNPETQYPMGGFKITNVSELQKYDSVIPEFISFIVESGVSAFSNLYWKDMKDSRPCYVTFTELELKQFGKVSGSVSGYLYNMYDPTNTPVPTYGSFENVTVYVK